MKRILILCLAVVFVIGVVGVAMAKNPLAAAEKAYYKKLTKTIPAKFIKNVDDLYAVWKQVMAGKSKAILLDVRTHPEFNAFHIPRASHIHAGHFYTVPGKIKDANAEIWVFCRTSHRSGYVVYWLREFGYKNVYWVKGGNVAWSKKKYPLVNYYLGAINASTYAKPDKWIKKVDQCAKPCVREWQATR